jgi:alpha/beta superfamily hydrolase
MKNNLITRLCNTLVVKSIIAFSFNFQGVGSSEGIFSIGTERPDDVKAAISYITSLNVIDPGRVGLAGYSAGASWGIAAAHQDPRVTSLAVISPPLSLFDFTILSDCLKQKYVISGSYDEHIQSNSFSNFAIICLNLLNILL